MFIKFVDTLVRLDFPSWGSEK